MGHTTTELNTDAEQHHIGAQPIRWNPQMSPEKDQIAFFGAIVIPGPRSVCLYLFMLLNAVQPGKEGEREQNWTGTPQAKKQG